MSTPQLQQLQKQIRSTGRLPGGAAYWSLATSLFQHPVVTAPGNRMAALASAQNATQQVGDAPPGFGKGFIWDRADADILLVLFINAADALGISIGGLHAGDILAVQSAAGIASFSEDTGDPGASSLVGLVGAGAKVGLGIAGFPEAGPLVDAAEDFAREQFKATNAKTKRRDAFGVDPGSGHLAREEGGLLVSLPEAGGAYYSGDDDHQDRWIRQPGDRTDDHRPPHVQFGFFPIQGFSDHNRRVLNVAGQVLVTPWDWKFDDNAGFYKVFVQLTRGTDPGPVVIERGTLVFQTAGLHLQTGPAPAPAPAPAPTPAPAPAPGAAPGQLPPD